MQFTLSKNVFYRPYGERAIITNLDTGDISVVNTTAATILSIIGLSGVDSTILESQLINAYGKSNFDLYCVPFIDSLLASKILESPDYLNGEIRTDGSIAQINKAGEIEIDALRNSAILPFEAYIEITQKCNLDCRHCYNDCQAKRELSFCDVTNIIDSLYDMGTVYITLTGGEPTLRKDFGDIVRHAMQRNICLKIKSNGNFSKKFDISVLESKNIREIHFSIYSFIQTEHDYVTRTPGSLSKTLKAVERLKIASQADVVINCPLTNVVSDLGLERLGAFCSLNGLMLRITHPITKRANFATDPLELRCSLSRLNELFSNNNTKVLILKGSELQYGVDDKIGNIESSEMCYAGKSLVAINAYGDVFPCIAWQEKCGNLHNNALANIWKNSPALLKIRSLTKDELACESCLFKAYANKCPGNAFSEHQDVSRFVEAECDICKLMQPQYHNSHYGNPVKVEL